MPLYEDAVENIRLSLMQIAKGERVSMIAIGQLTDRQISDINRARRERLNHLGEPDPFPPMSPEVVMIGKHLYNSRVVKDGYTIEAVVEQIVNALSERARFISTQRATLIQDPVGRTNIYGEFVRDEAVLECSTRYPRPELFSVIPKGETAPNRRKAVPDGTASSPQI